MHRQARDILVDCCVSTAAVFVRVSVPGHVEQVSVVQLLMVVEDEGFALRAELARALIAFAGSLWLSGGGGCRSVQLAARS